MAISMLKIRRPLGRLIFNMGIAIPGKTVFLIETAPWSLSSAATTTFLIPKTTDQWEAASPSSAARFSEISPYVFTNVVWSSEMNLTYLNDKEMLASFVVNNTPACTHC